ncbi:MAG: ArsA-related P-loop ATPase, partial [Nitriliruptorales bacterium]|nr:ArsA-related P-loop ATPase [Nitriliruptorales bacterium]
MWRRRPRRRGHRRGCLISVTDLAGPALVDGVLAGDRRALARALTMVEDGSPASLRELISGLWPATGSARVIGVTGSPGVGKSTLANSLASRLREAGRTVAIIAVDPSSPFS